MYGLGKWGCCEWINLDFVHFLSFFFFFFGGLYATAFTKPTVNRDLFDVQTLACACRKVIHYRIRALRRNSDRWRYKSVWRKWALVLGQPLYFFRIFSKDFFSNIHFSKIPATNISHIFRILFEWLAFPKYFSNISKFLSYMAQFFLPNSFYKIFFHNVFHSFNSYFYSSLGTRSSLFTSLTKNNFYFELVEKYSTDVYTSVQVSFGIALAIERTYFHENAFNNRISKLIFEVRATYFFFLFFLIV